MSTWQRLILGLGAGAAAGLVVNAYSRAMHAATGGMEADGASPGSNRVGRGMQPPQAAGSADDDATVRTGAIAYRVVTGHTPSASRARRLGVAAHYGFSMGAGATYALLATRFPALRRGHGALYGLLVWALVDETIVPALGLSRGPLELPPGVHAYSIVGHAIYGATLELLGA